MGKKGEGKDGKVLRPVTSWSPATKKKGSGTGRVVVRRILPDEPCWTCREESKPKLQG